LARDTLCLNPPPNNNPVSPISNAAPAGNISPASDVKLGGSNINNGPTTGGALNNNAGNAPATGSNSPIANGNGLKPNNNGLQSGTQGNLPNDNGNNGAINSNNGATRNQGGSNNGILANGNLETTSTGPIGGIKLNGQNSTGGNSAKSGAIGDTPKMGHHPMGKSEKQTQNHAGTIKGKSAANHKGQKSGAKSINGSLQTGTWSLSLQLMVALIIPFLTKQAVQIL